MVDIFFSIFLPELEIYCQDGFQKLSLLSTFFANIKIFFLKKNA